MPIVRGEHSFDTNFTQIPNAWLRDHRLSYKARGLLAELLSHSIGWEVSVARIASIGVDGRDAIGSAIQELENLGYLRREQQRDPSGRLAGNLWITQDPDQPSTEKPSTEKPSTDNPHPKNKIDKNTDLKEINAQFEKLWSEYPRRVGRANALKAFLRLDLDQRELAIEGAKRMALDPNLPPLQYVPYPATWINREGWLDEPYPERTLSKEEQAERAAKINKDKREKELKISQQMLREQQELERKIAADPPKRCKHDTIAVLCKLCATIK